MLLLPQQWASEDIVGNLADSSVLAKADTAWFVAYTADGRSLRWRLAVFEPFPAVAPSPTPAA
jgi:hypothetical protein